MFAKLLAISTVANSFLGFSASLAIILPVGVFSSLSVSISAGVSEKRATSAPEIRAEQNNNSINTAN